MEELINRLTVTNSLALPLGDDFFLFLESNNYSPQTVSSYKRDLGIFDLFLKTRNLEFKDLDKRQIFEFKAYLTSDERTTPGHDTVAQYKLSPASINRCLSSVRAYIRFLLDQDYSCPVAPDQFKMVKKDRSHPHIAELNEMTQLIEAPSSIEADPIISARNRAILEVLFATGMRISELTNLNKKDINDSNRIFITGKGRKQRFVYLTDRATLYLDSYLRLRSDNYPALFTPTKGKNTNSLKKRLTSRYIENKIQQYREKLKINIPITPHSLRHGFATYLAEEGASPVAIQILLGHESLNTTTRYVNASDRFAEDAHHKYHPLPDVDKKL